MDACRNRHYVGGMPRLNRAGKDLGRVLEWLLNRDVPDSEIGSALKLPKATYSRRKEADDFPDFAELIAVGEYFDLSPRVLQIAFGWRGEDELILLDIDEMRQYMEQAGVALFGNERIRRYIEQREGADYPLAAAILKMGAKGASPATEGN
ncbi:hypothetical protein B4U45_16060 [Mycobacterium persicum]|uniref:DNA-binding protein n=2 Tax=Mycobacterium persicum TaxID=1487726 RepID=A0A8E2IRK2_9MYCO|nr:hypothetical protein A4G31_10415 [Mycobacterium persicum]ORB51931.1 hypothetical protein BST40_09915 [Mycobacterium persicum]ORB89641.1 hypothetical protein B1T49_10860 [Mycobacterium persicum]ORB95086.1 hypothetical protein B1T44_11855 [Mycobacterium persicum]ORC07885.1 hypothetical protein B4U45_16060 [Mycobacterium persicum]